MLGAASGSVNNRMREKEPLLDSYMLLSNGMDFCDTIKNKLSIAIIRFILQIPKVGDKMETN